MLPDRVSNPGPLTYESGALPIALRGPATGLESRVKEFYPSPLWLCEGFSSSPSGNPKS